MFRENPRRNFLGKEKIQHVSSGFQREMKKGFIHRANDFFRKAQIALLKTVFQPKTVLKIKGHLGDAPWFFFNQSEEVRLLRKRKVRENLAEVSGAKYKTFITCASPEKKTH